MSEKEIKAAKIIQRSFRNYLTKREISSEEGNLTKQNKEREITTSKLEPNSEQTKIGKLQKEIDEIYAKLTRFYKHLPIVGENFERQTDVSTEIDEVIQELSAISSLEDCQRLRLEDASQEALVKHAEAMNDLSVKWWKDLNEKI